MNIRLTGSEKFRLFRKRAGLGFADFVSIWKVKLHKNTMSAWATGKSKPNAFFRKHIHILTKKLAPLGAFKLVISPTDWIAKSTVEVMTGEFLMLWRERKNIKVRDFCKTIGYSITLLSFIENGDSPSEDVIRAIHKATDGVVTREMWEADTEDKNHFF